MNEPEGIDAVDVLVAEIPVSGWTHIGIIYQDGAPSLFINGGLIKKGEASGRGALDFTPLLFCRFLCAC